MSKVEQATVWMEKLAADPKHGYDQVYRWGEKGDYDCSSAVITAWTESGVDLKGAGATYTGNMFGAAKKCGFTDVTKSVDLKTGKGLKRGDILLNKKHHVAMFTGSGKEVEASINEKGTAKGGQPGDQTGKEILVRSYRNYPWDCVLRYVEEEEKKTEDDTHTVKYDAQVTASWLNMRTSPEVGNNLCKTFGPLQKGTKLGVCQKLKTGWCLIKYNDKYGYCDGSWLKQI